MNGGGERSHMRMRMAGEIKRARERRCWCWLIVVAGGREGGRRCWLMVVVGREGRWGEVLMLVGGGGKGGKVSSIKKKTIRLRLVYGRDILIILFVFCF